MYYSCSCDNVILYPTYDVDQSTTSVYIIMWYCTVARAISDDDSALWYKLVASKQGRLEYNALVHNHIQPLGLLTALGLHPRAACDYCCALYTPYQDFI